MENRSKRLVSASMGQQIPLNSLGDICQYIEVGTNPLIQEIVMGDMRAQMEINGIEFDENQVEIQDSFLVSSELFPDQEAKNMTAVLLDVYVNAPKETPLTEQETEKLDEYISLNNQLSGNKKKDFFSNVKALFTSNKNQKSREELLKQLEENKTDYNKVIAKSRVSRMKPNYKVEVAQRAKKVQETLGL